MGHGIGRELESYRIEWRPDLTCQWVRLCSADTHKEAMRVLEDQHREHKGQVRVIVQHVIEVKGLGA